MRGTMMIGAVVAVMVAAVVAGRMSAARADTSAVEALQAMHEAAMAGILGSAEIQYPNRPSMFKSPVELRQYLDALNAYYAIAGRPRFGKRGNHGPQRTEELDDY
ncbi:uncharacterized protein [Cherax quadricarinatus]|uniref:Neuropeptide F2 n=1 Tax=Cherax quadricarinatus TaxID=27406 RepID=A0A2U8JAG6_CHEQU|nr:uncharacterized protein LOC128695403 [Cherax quadricarinatus]AWK57534.1 neuropeptide F2 [Cherax quadricarinatus]